MSDALSHHRRRWSSAPAGAGYFFVKWLFSLRKARFYSELLQTGMLIDEGKIWYGFHKMTFGQPVPEEQIVGATTVAFDKLSPPKTAWGSIDSTILTFQIAQSNSNRKYYKLVRILTGVENQYVNLYSNSASFRTIRSRR